MAKLLAAASTDFLPALAIAAFAGLRTSEILALDWRDVRLAERTMRVTHRKARCAGTRLAPIPENLAQWLTPWAKKVGPVWPARNNGHGANPLRRHKTLLRQRPGCCRGGTMGCAIRFAPAAWRQRKTWPRRHRKPVTPFASCNCTILHCGSVYLIQ
jgi:integrase